jgi:hypothetical protein
MLQNYNKILTKRTVFSIILESHPDQDLHKKNRTFYAPRFFSGQNRKKSAQITRANTVYDIAYFS